MTLKFLFPIALFWLAQGANAAQDVIVEARQSHLVFRGGDELFASSDGHHILLVKLIHEGHAKILEGDVLAGLMDPDLTTVQLELVGVNRCNVENACLDYSLPSIVINVGGIPEEGECTDLCRVEFLVKDDKVFRRTISRKPGLVIPHPSREFPLPSH